MKTEELMVLALAGLAAWLIVKGKPAGGGSAGYVHEILNRGEAWENGWKYYDDGVAIDPAGTYYKHGVKVWSPA